GLRRGGDGGRHPPVLDDARPQRAREGPAPGRRDRPAHDLGHLSDGELARTRDHRDVRRHVRGSPAPRDAPSPRTVRGPPAPQGLPAHVARGQAVAGRDRRGRGGRGVIAQAGVSFVNQWFDQYWMILVTKAAIVLVFFLVAPLGVGYAGQQGR